MTSLNPANCHKLKYPGKKWTSFETRCDPSVEDLISGLEKIVITDNGLVGRYDNATHPWAAEVSDEQIQRSARSSRGEGKHTCRYLDYGHFSIKWQLRDLEKPVARILAAIRSARNELRPVNRLPPEILAKVLEARKEERDLVSATHVCMRWREILTSASRLWTKIDFKYRGHLMCRYLERSKGALIDVTLGKGSDISRIAEIPIRFIPWHARMKSLRIRGKAGKIREITEGLCQETPNLRYLEIKGTLGKFCFPDNFLGRHAPSLQRLTFSSFSPGKFFTFPLPKLTHIDCVTETTDVVIEELLGLFESSPLLEGVRIHARIQTHVQEPSKKVLLRELNELDWADYGGSISLMPYLIAPKLNKLGIRVTHNPRGQRTVLSSILPPDGSHIPLLLEPTGMTYVHDHGNRTYCFAYPDTTSNLIVSQVNDGRNTDPTISSWFSPDFPVSFSRTRQLVVEIMGGFPPLEDVPIEKFLGLHELDLIGEVDQLVRIIDVNDGQPIPCTTLSKVRISPRDHRSCLSELRKVLEKRREAGHGVKTIRISRGDRCTEAEIEGLRGVVDEVITE